MLDRRHLGGQAIWLFAAVSASTLIGCKREKPPMATAVWLGPAGGCIGLSPHPKLGTLACWGTNDHGQIGDGTPDARPVASPMQFKEGAVTQLALGARHSCGVFDRKTLACWGESDDGQLGPSKSVHGRRLKPWAIPEFTSDGSALEVRVGGAHTCVRSADTLSCYGSNAEGQVYMPAGDPQTRGAALHGFALGDAHTCAAYGPTSTDRDRVWCRGRGFPLIVNGTIRPPAPLLDGVVVTALTAGADHTCALLADKTVTCWGTNDAGQLGDGTTNDTSVPVAVSGLRGVLEIAAGSRHTCARLGDNTVWCWGDNSHHQLVNGTTQRGTRPGMVPGIFGVAQIVAAGNSACARLGDGDVRCWGANDHGQLGDNSTVEHDVPMPPLYR